MKFIERFLSPEDGLSTIERKFSLPKTVGTARVKNVLTIGQNPPFEVVYLDLKTQFEWDRSGEINRVPTGWFKKGDIAEIIVRDYKGSYLDPKNWPILFSGGFCIVAVRPFRPGVYGEPFAFAEEPYKGMFDVNIKSPAFSPAFYQKFGLSK